MAKKWTPVFLGILVLVIAALAWFANRPESPEPESPERRLPPRETEVTPSPTPRDLSEQAPSHHDVDNEFITSPEESAVFGIVYDRETMQSLAGVTVYLVHRDISLKSVDNWQEAVIDTAISGADGRFRLRDPWSLGYCLFAHKEGYAWGVRRGSVYTRFGTRLRIYLKPPAILEGTCRDEESGLAVSGATVSEVRALDDFQASHYPVPLSASTDREGRFRLDGIPAGLCRATIRAPGYITRQATLSTENPQTVSLKKGDIVVRGKVLTKITNRPAAGKKILFQIAHTCVFEGETDHQGRFEIHGLMPGRTLWKIRWNHDMPFVNCGDIMVSPSGNKEQILFCPEPATIRGRVLDKETGQPVTGGKILFGWEKTPRTFLELDSDGTFLAENLLVNVPIRVSFSIPGYFASFQEYGNMNQNPWNFTLPVENEQDLENLGDLTLWVEPSTRISGTVIDSVTSRAVPGAFVQSGATLHHAFNITDRTDAEGRFELDLPSKDREFKFLAGHPDYGIAVRDLSLPSRATSHTLVLEMTPSLVQNGKVTDGNGNLIAGAEISVSMAYHTKEHPVYIPIDSLCSDPGGGFVFRPLQQGEYKLQARADGYGPGELVTILPTGDLELVLSREYQLVGKVVDDRNDPLEGMQIVTYPHRQAGLAITDSEGRFELGGLPQKGRITLNIRGSEDVISYREHIDLPHEGDLIIVIPRPGGLRGRVVDAGTGEPATEYEVDLYQLRSGSFYPDRQTVFRENGGIFFSGNLKSGKYAVLLSDSTRYRLVQDVDVKPGETVDLGDLTLESRYGALEVTSRDSETGESLAGCFIQIYRKRDGSSIQLPHIRMNEKTNKAGKVRFEKVIPGDYYVYGKRDGFHTKNMEVAVELDRTAEVEITFVPGALLHGIVLDGPTGKPVEDARVEIRNVHPPNATRTDELGRFTLENVGRVYPVKIMVTATGRASVEKEIKLEAREEWIEIILESGHFLAGRITDEEEQPLERVRVSLYGGNSFNTYANTEKDGSFRLEGIPDMATFQLSAYKQGYENIRENIDALDREDSNLVMKTLDTHRLKAIRPDGSPVTEQAVVSRIMNYIPQNPMNRIHPEGLFDLGGLQPGHYEYEVRVGKIEGGRTFFQVKGEDEDKTHEIVIRPLCRFHGVVQNEEEMPVPDADIVIGYGKSSQHHEYNYRYGWFKRQSHKSLKSNEQGIFEESLPEGPYIVFIEHQDYPMLSSGFTLEKEEWKEKVFTLKGGARLSGKVYYEETNDPAPGMNVHVSRYHEGQNFNQNTKTDQEGRFSFSSFQPGTYSLTVRDQGGLSVSRSVDLEKNAQVNLDIPIPSTLSVTMVFMKGEYPVSGKYISVNSTDQRNIHFSAKTDSSGRTPVTIPPGPYKVSLWEMNFNEDITVEPGDEGREFVFQINPTSLKVRLVDAETERPISGHHSVYLRTLEKSRNFHGRYDRSTGWFHFENLEPDTYELHTGAFEDYVPFKSEPIVIEEGDKQEFIVPLRKGLELKIACLDAGTGERIDERLRGSVKIKGTHQYLSTTQSTKEKGILLLKGLDEGEYMIRVSSPHYQSDEIEVRMDPESPREIEIRLKPMSALLLKATDALTGTSLFQKHSNIRVRLLDEKSGRDMHFYREKEEGPIPPGSYHYTVELKGYESVEGEILLLERETATLEVKLNPKEQ